MQKIETKRLILRSFTVADWQDFQELGLDWKAAPGPDFDKWQTSEEASRESVEYMATADNYYAVCLRETGKVIGLLGINVVDAEGRLDLGHVILSIYQDNDIDREALQAIITHCFATYDIQAVITHNAPEHAAQLAPLLSLGFANLNPADEGELVLSKDDWRRLQVR